MYSPTHYHTATLAIFIWRLYINLEVIYLFGFCRFAKMYWTDANIDRVMCADLDGNNKEVIASGSNVVHPYAIGMYKVMNDIMSIKKY